MAPTGALGDGILCMCLCVRPSGIVFKRTVKLSSKESRGVRSKETSRKMTAQERARERGQLKREPESFKTIGKRQDGNQIYLFAFILKNRTVRDVLR